MLVVASVASVKAVGGDDFDEIISFSVNNTNGDFAKLLFDITDAVLLAEFEAVLNAANAVFLEKLIVAAFAAAGEAPLVTAEILLSMGVNGSVCSNYSDLDDGKGVNVVTGNTLNLLTDAQIAVIQAFLADGFASDEIAALLSSISYQHVALLLCSPDEDEDCTTLEFFGNAATNSPLVGIMFGLLALVYTTA